MGKDWHLTCLPVGSCRFLSVPDSEANLLPETSRRRWRAMHQGCFLDPLQGIVFVVHSHGYIYIHTYIYIYIHIYIYTYIYMYNIWIDVKLLNRFPWFIGLQGACGHHANACQRSYAWWWKPGLIWCTCIVVITCCSGSASTHIPLFCN